MPTSRSQHNRARSPVLSRGGSGVALMLCATNSWFPGAFQTAGGHWRFPLDDGEAVRSRLESLRARNNRRDLTPVDCNDESAD